MCKFFDFDGDGKVSFIEELLGFAVITGELDDENDELDYDEFDED